MRVIKQSLPDKNNPEPGKTYAGKIVEHKFTQGVSKKNGQPWYGLTLIVKPNQEDLFKIKAFDFVGQDETGYFIYAGSKMETWIKRIMNLPTLETFRIDSLIGKPCLFVVEKAPGRPDPKNPSAPPKDFFNINDILCLPIEAIVSQPTPAVLPAPVVAAVSANPVGAANVAPQVTAAAAPAAKKTDSWAEGDVL